MRAPAVAAVFAALLVSHAGAATTTGLRGTVRRGPITPVCTVGTPCDEPAANVTLAFVRHGHVVRRTRTSEAGGYRVTLPAGTYAVRTAPAPRIGRGIEPATVRVVSGRIRRVDFSIDTGIR